MDSLFIWMDSATFGMSLDLDLASDNKSSRCMCILDHLFCSNEALILCLASSLKMIHCRIMGHTLDSINRLDLKMSG
ncbi:hypothetical protein K0M31_020260 [Melipona bicolor]|uniref:Uncharacterized protein n=1 Tax=Melipona bicolor TaxID=60889 RepID=A0AA40KQT2_9HYME|nr:hypothetical protein K0M31_020260 [Melipona bicolor]